MEPACEPFIGWMGVRDGRIAALAAGDAPNAEAGETVDADGRIVMPGLVNGHCHGDMTIFRGVGDDMTLAEQNEAFLENCWFGCDLTDEERYAARQLVYLKAVRSGTTFLAEHMYWGLGLSSVRAMDQVGIRGALAEQYFTDKSLDPAGGHITAEYLDEFIAECRRNGLLPMLSSVAEETFEPELMERVIALAQSRGIMVTQHLQETPWRMRLIREKYGCTPMRFLADHGLLGRVRIVASHAVYANAEDRALMKSGDVAVDNTPVCEMKICDGVAPLKEYIADGVILGLGTDGAMWDNTNDMFGEIKYAVLLQTITKGIRSMTARQALEAATIGGARVFGMENEIGTLTVGKSADFILVDATGTHMRPLRLGVHENVLSDLAYSACGRDVTDTFVRGKAVMRERAVRTIDETVVFRAAESASERILSKYGPSALKQYEKKERP